MSQPMQRRSPLRTLTRRILMMVCAVLIAVPAAAVGPESTAIVVNAESWASQAVANEYAALRQIPPANIVRLNLGDLSSFEGVSVDTFRQRILRPVLAELERRGLSGQIDCIAYSADVPHTVAIADDFKGKETHKVLTKAASVNGLTYLYQSVLAGDGEYLGLQTNMYARRFKAQPLEPKILPQPPQGFSSQVGWTAQGAPSPALDKPRYLLSCMLAVTSGRGTSVEQALAGLRRSVGADGARPEGTVYILKNGDVRSTTREWAFESTVAYLEQLGVKAKIVNGVVPRGADDVAGVVIGSGNFDWAGSGSTLLPGAIAEHLTSYGGVMRWSSGQTPLSDLMRAGAAGSSGTVAEPYAIQAKFPTPFIHYYYAAGSTLIEAFYQSVLAPYQLLIVGDPLCRPWGQSPELNLALPEAPLSGPVTLRPGGASADVTVKRYELYVDGRRHAQAGPAEPLVLDTTALPDGWHELRLVVVSASAVEQTARWIGWAQLDNTGRTPPKGTGPATVALGEPIALQAQMAEASAIEWYHQGRCIQRTEGPSGQVELDSAQLGLGPAAVQPVGVIEGESVTRIPGEPVELTVTAPPLMEALPAPVEERVPGLRLELDDGSAWRLSRLQGPKDEQQRLGQVAPKGVPFTLEGWLTIETAGLYQVQVPPGASLTVEVNGQRLPHPARSIWRMVPLHLAAGVHHLRVEGRGVDLQRLDVRFGGPGSWPLGERHFSCPASLAGLVETEEGATTP